MELHVNIRAVCNALYVCDVLEMPFCAIDSLRCMHRMQRQRYVAFSGHRVPEPDVYNTYIYVHYVFRVKIENI